MEKLKVRNSQRSIQRGHKIMRIRIHFILFKLMSMAVVGTFLGCQTSVSNRTIDSMVTQDDSVIVDYYMSGHEIRHVIKNNNKSSWVVLFGMPVGNDGYFHNPFFSFIEGEYSGFYDRSTLGVLVILKPSERLVTQVNLKRNYKNLNLKASVPPSFEIKEKFSVFSSQTEAEKFVTSYYKTGDGPDFSRFTYKRWHKL